MSDDNRRARLDRRREVHIPAIHLGHERVRGQTRPDGPGNLKSRDPLWELLQAPIREGELNVWHAWLTTRVSEEEGTKLTDAARAGQTGAGVRWCPKNDLKQNLPASSSRLWYDALHAAGDSVCDANYKWIPRQRFFQEPRAPRAPLGSVDRWLFRSVCG